MLAVERLSHRYGERQALHAVDLQVRPGTLVGLLGPNGGGKSTLLGVLSTRLKPQDGTARIFDYDLRTDAAQIRHRIGVVFQRPALDRRLTVNENLAYAGQLYGLRGSALQQRIRETLAQFRLEDRVHSIVDTLSGGLARRVELAKALLHRPELILLDEPSTGLDPAARRDLWSALHQLKGAGVTALVSTHLASEGEQCDEVHVLHQGKLVASGPPQQLQQSIGHDIIYVQTSNADALQHYNPQLVDGQLRIESSRPKELVAELLQLPDIQSLTISKPSLEDVFFLRTGDLLDPAPEVPTSLWPAAKRR